MFGTGKGKSKHANVISHWYTPVPNFSTSTKEFYSKVEAELKAQEVPGLDLSRVEFAEGGLMSAKREYLRMTRERLVFDVCAAPFGVNYFFSCRFAELPIGAKGGGVLLLFVIVGCLWGLLSHLFGATGGSFASIISVGIMFYVLCNLPTLGLLALEEYLMKNPTWAPIYEALRKESYYREDTRLMYLTVVEGVIKKLVEQETAAKGVKLLQEYEYAPILGDLYKPKTRTVSNPVTPQS